MVPHKKNIPGVRRQQLKLIANRSLSGNLLVVSETNCVDDNKLWKILKETGIPDHLAYLLRNLYAGQEATVKTGHGLAIINSAVMNIGVHVFLSILVSSVCMPSNEIAGSE